MAQRAATPGGSDMEPADDPVAATPASGPEAPSPPRVHRGFGFVDLCGFTDFVDEHGDLAGLAELAALRRNLREAAPLNAARVDKWLGDGALIIGLDLGAVLATVLTVACKHRRRGRLALRAGVTAGPAIMCDDDYVGRVVNLAARLCDVAPPGQGLVQLDDGLVLPDWTQVRPAGDLAIKGLTQPVAMVQVAPRPYDGPARPPT